MPCEMKHGSGHGLRALDKLIVFIRVEFGVPITAVSCEAHQFLV
ncbi:MAG: hypothetical protein ACJAW0_002009 [Zhongshania sp.]|jgi:hypothetical protein